MFPLSTRTPDVRNVLVAYCSSIASSWRQGHKSERHKYIGSVYLQGDPNPAHEVERGHIPIIYSFPSTHCQTSIAQGRIQCEHIATDVRADRERRTSSGRERGKKIMSEEVDPLVVQRTQLKLGKYIQRPQLTEKLLRRPPFRFLHDIVTAVSIVISWHCAISRSC